MKRSITLGLIICSLLIGTCFLYGFDYEKPDNSNVSITNNTGIDFLYIGVGNKDFKTVISKADNKFLDKYEKLYFNLENLEENEIYSIKVVDKDKNVYKGMVEISENSNIIIKTVKDEKLKTNADIEKNENINFDILSMVKGWYCRVENNNILSKYSGTFKHATTVMGKGGKIVKSKYVKQDETSTAQDIKGSEEYSWISIYH